ncbi:unnamed protein product [Victoria cruziana]
MEELHQFPKIKDTYQEIEFQLFGESYQLVEPLIKERDVYESITYSSELYVPVGLIWRTSRNMQEQTILLGNIPLMNSLGTSIVNEIYRIVINQVLQSLGIYYSIGLDHNGIFVYTGTITSDWGGRSELEIDRKERIWARVSRKQKIYILVLSSAMSSSLREILDNVCYPEIFLSFPNEKEKKRLVQRKILNLDIPQNNTFLLPRDVLATADHLIGMKFGMGTLDDMNHLKNKQNVVRGTTCGVIRHKLIPTPRNLVTSTPLTTTYESFFGLHPLSQVLHQTNPLTQIVHGQKSSYLVTYGHICPIDTSEGINVGLIGSLAIHVRVGDWGYLKSPFYEISERSKEERMVYLSPSRDEYYMVAARNSLTLTRGLQEEEVGPAQYCQECLTVAWEQIHLRNIYFFQYFSIGASLIPFIEHNYVNRDLMSSNMQHQAVPLSQSEKYIVGTDLECQVALDLGGSAIAEREGNIIYTDAEKIVLLGNGDTISISLGQILADGAATVGGELALEKNISVAYMPWEGYNSEDVVLISEHLVYDDIYTSFHIQKYEIQTHVTSQGPQRITNEIPHLEPYLLRNLDRNGIVMLGSWVETSDILVVPEKGGSIYNPEMIHVYISQKRKIKVGDKVSGRHGNKGIISKILPRQDIPYLQDGIPVDMAFNLLGVPSRMNVGQIHYRITPFDERYVQEASRKLVFSELYEASKQTINPWVFEPEYPGKSRIFDGRTGDPFEQPIIIRKSYMLKLIHQVDDKIHERSSGHYALVTQQSLRGRAKQGGQRVGEMKVWALEGFGVAHILQEMLTYKSDHIRVRQEVLGTTMIGGTIPNPEGASESFRFLVCELRS